LITEVLKDGRLEIIDEIYSQRLASATRRCIASFRASFPGVHIEIVGLIAEDHTVLGRFTCSATRRGE
jgi:hypothetical protein